MKKYILFFLLLTAIQAFGKKDDPKDLKIDSLTKANAALTMQLDSVTKNLVVYTGLYATIKEKVLHYDFDPANFSYIIDSLRASRDSSFMAKSNSNAVRDSLANINSEKNKLKTASDEDIRRNEIITELKQLKDLLDTKIITFTEYDALKAKLLTQW